MQKYFNNVTNRDGAVVPSARVTVTTLAGAAATIYSDNGTTVTANPIVCDSNGYFEFYAADGRYTLSIYGAGISTKTISDIILEDPVENVAAVTAINNRNYPGSYTSDPTTRPDGSAIQAGDSYFNSTSKLRVQYSGTAWAPIYNPASVAITGGTIGSVPIRTYLGVVASRGAVPSAFAAANKQTMSRSKHVAMDNIASLQLVMANFYLKSSNPNEATPGASAQYTASIEYPVGTLTSVTFSGSLTGTVADGSTMVSDAVAVSIPRGAAFYVRMWQSCSAGILYCGGAGLNNVNAGAPNSGEWFVFGATTPDLTQSTANSNNQQSGIHFRPTAIIGYTSRPSFMLAGDSRHGNGATYDASANGYGGVGEVERSLVKSFATLNAGCPGDTLANAAGTGWSKRLPLAQYCSHVICEYGINDFTAGTSLATMLANLSTFANKFGTKPFYQTTISPKSASTDSWATTANQTTDATANPLRVSFNNAVRQGLSAPVSGYIEVADQVESARDSGLWKVTGSANGYTADGLHGNSACNSLIEASAAFQNIAMD